MRYTQCSEDDLVNFRPWFQDLNVVVVFESLCKMCATKAFQCLLTFFANVPLFLKKNSSWIRIISSYFLLKECNFRDRASIITDRFILIVRLGLNLKLKMRKRGCWFFVDFDFGSVVIGKVEVLDWKRWDTINIPY